MITFFYEMARKAKLNKRVYWSLIYKVNKVLINIFFPITQRWKNSCGVDKESRIIVSLTTYPARISSVWITIASLLQQTQKPYKIILWLAEEQFPNRKVPGSLERLKKRGLEIRFCEDLKPHKKYYYSMIEYPNYFIITADDDILYPENHIQRLWQGYERYPNTVICQWSHQIEFDIRGEFQPYDDWQDNTEKKPAYSTLAVGCNGILYPPHCLPREAFQKKKILENALYTDDLWLKCMEILNGWKTVNCNETIMIYFNLISTQKSGLWKKNTGSGNNNNRIWSRLMELYPEVKGKLIEEKKYDECSI